MFPALYLIFHITWQSKQSTVTFYGFAENKETELNFDKSVIINHVHVTPGEFVSMGDTLLTMTTHYENEVKISDVNHQIQSLEVKDEIDKKDIESSIRKLEAIKMTKLSEIESKIRTLQSEIDLNQSILAELKSVDLNGTDMKNSPNQIKIQVLRKEKEMAVKPLDAEINKLKLELSQIGLPSKVEINKLKNEAQIRKKEEDKIIILAPSDGLVGNIHCKVGENISSFNTLVSFYEENPTLVKGYVHENLILQVEVGDTVNVISSYHPENNVIGTVAGLGSRIVEIPERLRKLPEIKTYGREVSIQLPVVNTFLQKEKVVLNLLDVDPLLLNDNNSKQRKKRNDVIEIPVSH